MGIIRIVIAVFVLLGLVESAAAKAHCHCKMARWQSSPVSTVSGVVHDFGDIAVWNTQIGHDGTCQALCSTKNTDYFNGLGPAGRASLCAGGAVYGYSAVGGKNYNGIGELPCPTVGPPKLWLVGQAGTGATRTVTVGLNRTLLPSGPLRVCVNKIGTTGQGCYNAPGNASSTGATLAMSYLQSNTNYRVVVKRKLSLANVYVPVTSIDIHVN